MIQSCKNSPKQIKSPSHRVTNQISSFLKSCFVALTWYGLFLFGLSPVTESVQPGWWDGQSESMFSRGQRVDKKDAGLVQHFQKEKSSLQGDEVRRRKRMESEQLPSFSWFQRQPPNHTALKLQSHVERAPSDYQQRFISQSPPLLQTEVEEAARVITQPSLQMVLWLRELDTLCLLLGSMRLRFCISDS